MFGQLASHFDTRRFVSALFVELDVFRAAVEDRFGASHIQSYRVESIHHVSPQAGALVLLGNANFLNMSHGSAIMDANKNVINRCVTKWKVDTGEMVTAYNFFSATTIPVPTIRP